MWCDLNVILFFIDLHVKKSGSWNLIECEDIFFSSLRWNGRCSVLLMINTKTITPSEGMKMSRIFQGGFLGYSIPGSLTFKEAYLIREFSNLKVCLTHHLTICTFTICKKQRNYFGRQQPLSTRMCQIFWQIFYVPPLTTTASTHPLNWPMANE